MKFYYDASAEWNLLKCPARLGSIPGPRLSVSNTFQISHLIPPTKKGNNNLIRRSECTSLLGRIYIHQMPAHVSFLAWQAHYDLKDPAGLAGFLIDSDIKLVRAESGSSDESSRHKSSRRHESEMGCTKWRENKVSNYPTVDKGVFLLFGVLFCFFFTPQVGVVSTSVGLHSRNKCKRHALKKKQEDTESTSSAVIPGTSGACWMLMVVSLGGRKPKPRPSPMLLGHHVLHWWAMKKYKRGQMSAMTAEICWKRHQFLQEFRHSLNFAKEFRHPCIHDLQKVLETLEVLKIARSMQTDSANSPQLKHSISTEFTAA